MGDKFPSAFRQSSADNSIVQPVEQEVAEVSIAMKISFAKVNSVEKLNHLVELHHKRRDDYLWQSSREINKTPCLSPNLNLS